MCAKKKPAPAKGMCDDCGRKPRAKKRTICHSCRHKRTQNLDPVRYAYYVHKNNAKRRGVVYGLTLEDFRKFAQRTDYMNGKGRSATGYHIDRIKEEKGYFKGNIQVLTNRENVKKYISYDPDTKTFKTKERLDMTGTDDEYPF